MAGIYVHIPFCKQACHYCDFHFSTSSNLKPKVLKAIERELVQRRSELDSPVLSVYFGGGTPSILEEVEMRELMACINSNYDVVDDAEITIECNPDDMSVEKLKSWKELGFNRLSIGVQSFRDEHLKLMNRAHDQEEACESIRSAREAGFDNISLDLIYGIPGMDMATWKENIEKAVSFEPQHVSAYCLTIEPKTVFGHWNKIGKLSEEKSEVAAQQFEVLKSMLADSGIEQYEVSNFGSAGFESKHNSSYWKNVKYLGFGPSAHSFDGMVRRWNVANNARYVNAIESDEVYWESEVLSKRDQFNERVMTGLRTIWGVDMAELKKETGFDLLALYTSEISGLEGDELAVRDAGVLRLTAKGLLQADRIASDFFIIES